MHRNAIPRLKNLASCHIHIVHTPSSILQEDSHTLHNEEGLASQYRHGDAMCFSGLLKQHTVQWQNLKARQIQKYPHKEKLYQCRWSSDTTNLIEKLSRRHYYLISLLPAAQLQVPGAWALAPVFAAASRSSLRTVANHWTLLRRGIRLKSHSLQAYTYIIQSCTHTTMGFVGA